MSLYRDNETYNPDGISLSDEAYDWAGEVIGKYFEKGYKIREISQIMQAAIQCRESEMILSKNLQRYKKEKGNL